MAEHEKFDIVLRFMQDFAVTQERATSHLDDFFTSLIHSPEDIRAFEAFFKKNTAIVKLLTRKVNSAVISAFVRYFICNLDSVFFDRIIGHYFAKNPTIGTREIPIIEKAVQKRIHNVWLYAGQVFNQLSQETKIKVLRKLTRDQTLWVTLINFANKYSIEIDTELYKKIDFNLFLNLKHAIFAVRLTEDAFKLFQKDCILYGLIEPQSREIINAYIKLYHCRTNCSDFTVMFYQPERLVIKCPITQGFIDYAKSIKLIKLCKKAQ